MNALLHQQSRAGDARLSGRREDARDRALHRVVDLGIVEDDVRRLAAELHRDVLQPARGGFVDPLTGRVGAGERDLRHERMLDERRTDVGAEAGDDVDDAGREAGVLDQLHELEHRRRRELGRLDDDRVACSERRRQLPRRQQQRRVPGDDRGDDAERLVARVVEGVGLVGRDHRAFDLVGEPAVVVVPLRHVRRLHAHLGVQLAVVADFDLGQLLRALGDEIAEPAQQRTAARCGQLRPLAGRERLDARREPRDRRRRRCRVESAPRARARNGSSLSK